MQNTELNPIFAAGKQKAIVLFVIGIVVLGAVAIFNPLRAQQAYLYGYIFWMAFTLGGLACLMLHHMVAGAWGFMIQRIVEAAARTIPVMAVLFVPIALSMPALYPWHPDYDFSTAGHAVHAQDETHAEETHAEEAHADDHHAEGDHGDHGDHHTQLVKEMAAKKERFLNPSTYLVCTVVYFLVWMALTWILTSSSMKLDNTRREGLVILMRRVGSVGMCIFFLTMTFSATHWTMSLEPIFFSTMYPPTFIVGAGLTIIAFSIIVLSKLKDYKPFSEVYNIEIVHHLGNLLLAFTVLWAYTNFSQYLIIWSGNLAEEIPYYLHRDEGGLLAVSIILMAFHFIVPFFILLWRRSKRNIGFLRKIAAWMIFMRLLDLYWVITPAFSPDKFRLPIAEIAAVLAIGGIWLYFFNASIQKRPLLTSGDPRQVEAFAKWEGAHDHA